MSDFTSDFWGPLIAFIAVAGALGCVLLVVVQGRASTGSSGVEVETMGHVWDEDIQEYDNPLPRWWMGMFFLTVIFGFVYWALYPGLGSYKGLLGWTQTGQWEKEVAEVEAAVAPIFARYSKMDLREVAADKEAVAIGRRLFMTYCIQCHGSDARGAKGFPNLADDDWLWGGEPEQIRQSIANGREGMMPDLGLTSEAVGAVTQYIRSLSGLEEVDWVRVKQGGEVFNNSGCTGCHGPDAKGSYYMGAPNLTDKIWLHGSSEIDILETIGRGRQSRMPSWIDFLGDAKVHLLAAYVLSLGPQAPRP